MVKLCLLNKCYKQHINFVKQGIVMKEGKCIHPISHKDIKVKNDLGLINFLLTHNSYIYFLNVNKSLLNLINSM